MRQAWTISGILLTLALGLPVRAESAFVDATISVPEVQIRSGPSEEYYITSKLHQGDAVKIVEDKTGNLLPIKPGPGWVAIKPPGGSFSWIQVRFLDRQGPYATVLGSDVPVRVGSSLVNKSPTVQQIKLQRGALVVVLSGDRAYDGEGGWVPIAPPDKEVRYIPANAVNRAPAVQSTVNSTPGNFPANASPDALWAQAEQAEKAGRLDEAIHLYEELGKKTDKTNFELSNRCMNRSQYLRSMYRGASNGGYPGRPNDAYYPGTNRQGYYCWQPTSNCPQPAQVGRAMSQYGNASSTFPVRSAQTSAYANNSQPATMAQWSGPGTLRRSTVPIDGKVAYVLDLSTGPPQHWYITDQTGNLGRYVNRNVNLYGSIVYHGELRTYLLTATQVVPTP